VPDRNGVLGDVVLGFDSASAYTTGHPYFGSTIGRFANRIARGQFTLDGHTYSLPLNDGGNHLHGGPGGFHTVLWTAIPDAAANALTLQHRSVDREQGYPGNLDVEVRYALSNDDGLRIDYTARTDAPTIVNLTNHAYFNLACGGTILGHVLQVFGSRFIPVDAARIPLGSIAPVSGTPFDFTDARTIGSRIEERDEQLLIGPGYDHTWVLDGGGEMRRVAELYEPASGRTMTIHTTQPGLQIYSGNFLDGSVRGKGGAAYPRHAGLCLETQHFPDSPNQPAFPSTVLAPGETFRESTIYRFGTRP
jgi:aldose 1-epimerase